MNWHGRGSHLCHSLYGHEPVFFKSQTLVTVTRTMQGSMISIKPLTSPTAVAAGRMMVQPLSPGDISAGARSLAEQERVEV